MVNAREFSCTRRREIESAKQEELEARVEAQPGLLPTPNSIRNWYHLFNDRMGLSPTASTIATIAVETNICLTYVSAAVLGGLLYYCNC